MSPTRSCVVCRKKANKNELLRIVSNKRQAQYDVSQKINSRGIYFCKDNNCIEKAQKSLLRNKLNVKLDLNKESLIQLLDNIKDELGE